MTTATGATLCAIPIVGQGIGLPVMAAGGATSAVGGATITACSAAQKDTQGVMQGAQSMSSSVPQAAQHYAQFKALS